MYLKKLWNVSEEFQILVSLTTVVQQWILSFKKITKFCWVLHFVFWSIGPSSTYLPVMKWGAFGCLLTMTCSYEHLLWQIFDYIKHKWHWVYNLWQSQKQKTNKEMIHIEDALERWRRLKAERNLKFDVEVSGQVITYPVETHFSLILLITYLS